MKQQITFIFIIIHQLFKDYNTLIQKGSLVSQYNYPQTLYSNAYQGIRLGYANNKEQTLKENVVTNDSPKGYRITETPTVFLPYVCEVFVNRQSFWFYDFATTIKGEKPIASSSFSPVYYSSNYYIIYTTENPPTDYIVALTYDFISSTCNNWNSFKFSIGDTSIASGVTCYYQRISIIYVL